MAEKKKKKISKKWKVILTVVVVLVAIRLALPYIVLHFANKTLAEMDGYYGHIEDVDLAIYRGAYQINNIYLNKIDSVTNAQTPFFDSRVIDLSVEWKALFNGSIAGELVFHDPSLYFSKEKVEPDELQKDTNDFRKLLKDFMPLKVNRFEVLRGKIHFLDSTVSPVVNIKMDNTYILAQNLTNVVDTTDEQGLPASIRANANVYRGRLEFDMKIDPLAEKPRFDMNARITDTYLPDLNPFFNAYAKVDVNKGEFGMYTEVAAKDGKFKGYVKPLLKDLDIRGKEDRDDNFFRKTWESIAGTASDVLKNWSKDQLATKIPFEGRLDDPNTNIWVTIYEMLKNAFINALQPSIDHEINISAVEATEPEKKNILEKIFGGDDSKKDEDKKKDNEKDKRKE